MATRKTPPHTLVLDPTPTEAPDVYDTPGSPEAPTFSDDTDSSLCPSCGEPLAWHDDACTPATAPPPPVETAAEDLAPAASLDTSGLTPTPFVYSLGQPVQPTPDAPPAPIIWRGQIKVRHPRTGWWHRLNVYRLNVYRLNDGYWDCHYETDLQAA